MMFALRIFRVWQATAYPITLRTVSQAATPGTKAFKSGGEGPDRLPGIFVKKDSRLFFASLLYYTLVL